MADQQHTIPNYQLYTIMLLMLIFGTCNTIVMKWQDEVIVDDTTDPPTKFTHPYFQCANMFVGELMCLVVYGIKLALKGKKKDDEDEVPLSPGSKMAQTTQLKTKINPLYLAIPASFDICGTTLMFVALTQCAASIYQMMRGIIVVITAVMSIVFLGKKQYFHHWFSLVTIVSGVAIVGLVGIYATKDESSDSSQTPTTVLGIVLLLVAQCFTGG